MMRKIILLAFCLLAPMAFAQCPDPVSNAGYILAGAAGGNGSSWTAAYSGFGTGAGQANPATLVRGCTYYVAVGNYSLGSQVVFSTPDSGTSRITIQAPTATVHGTNTGWSNSFVGQAQWSCLGFTTDYWTFNGAYRSTATGIPANDWKLGYGFYIYNTNGSGVPLCPSGDSSSVSWGAGGTSCNNCVLEYTHVHGSGDTTGTYIDLGLFGNYALNPVVQYNYFEKVGSCFIKLFQDVSLADTALVQYNMNNNDQSTTANHGCGFGLMADHGTGGARITTDRYNILENVEGTAYWDAVDCENCSGSYFVYGDIYFTNPAEWDGNCNLCTPSTGNQDGYTPWVSELFAEPATPGNLTEFAFWNNTIYNLSPSGDTQPNFVGSCDWNGGTMNMNIANLYIQNNLWVNCPGEATINPIASGTLTCSNNSYYNTPTTTGLHPPSTVCPNSLQAVTGAPLTQPFVSVTGDNFNLTADTAPWTPLPAPYDQDMFGNQRTSSRGAIQFSGSAPPQASTPVFSPTSPYSGSATTLAISAATGTVICWNNTGNPATNGGGTPPCAVGTQYTGPITISASQTVYAVAGGTGYQDSPVATWTGTIAGGQLAKPVCTPGTGTYSGNVSVSCTLPSGSTGCYTLTGTPPTAPTAGSCGSGSTRYTTGTISISTSGTNLQMLATEVGYTNSNVASYTYTITTSNTFFIAQTAAGTGSGTSCANALAVTFFNTTANWGTGSGQIGPGSVVNLCGTITSQITMYGSGTPSNPITLQWQPGAQLSSCSTTGALAINGRSYLVLDLGANAPAITCPNNGSGLTTSINAIGIYALDLASVEIRNGTIGPIYVHSGSDTNVTSAGISVFGANNIYFHNLTLDWMEKGIHVQLGNGMGNTSGNVISNNFCDGTSGDPLSGTTGGCIVYVDGDTATHTDTGAQVYGNSCVLGIAWAGSSAHITCFDFFQQSGTGATDNILGLLIYNNFFTSDNVRDTSAYLELTDGLVGCNTNSILTASIFNNLFVQTGTWVGGDGFIFEHGCYHTDLIANNTLVNTTTTNSVGMSLNGPDDGPPGYNTYTVENNIIENPTQFYSNAINPSGGSKLTSNNNIFYSGTDAWYWNGTNYPSLATWQSAIGQDLNSSVGNPGLNSNYTITSASSLAYQFGPNLTSLGIAQLNVGAPLTWGPSGACGAGCLARATTGQWDAGIYPYSSTAPGGLAPPVCTPTTGTFTNNVVITCTLPAGATGCYTTNGTPPTATSGTCGGGSSTGSGTTISSNSANKFQILATESGFTNSAVTSDTYTLTVAQVGCMPGSGNFVSSVNVTCSDSTTSTNIFYAVGATPTCSSTPYAPITVTSTKTLNFIGCRPGYNNSIVSSYTYTVAVATPTLNPSPGTFSTPPLVTMTSSTSGSTIIYTTDGSTPGTTTGCTPSGTGTAVANGSSITISTTTTFAALGCLSGDANSSVTSGLYTISSGSITLNPPNCTPNMPLSPSMTYNNDLRISCTLPTGSTGCYTLNGTVPGGSSGTCAAGSTQYTAPFIISNNNAANVQILATETGFTNSSVVQYNYTLVVANPSCTKAGTYSPSVQVTCSDVTNGASIYYSTTGTATCSSTLYTGPIPVTATSTYSFVGCLAGFNTSNYVTYVYSISSTVPTAPAPQLLIGKLSGSTVDLSWKAPPPMSGVTLTGYTVWRTARTTFTNPSNIATVRVPTTTFQDKKCTAICMYAVSANCVAPCKDSGFSNVVKVAVK